ncbi:MAG: CoB--CoM heterodisulfide reductase iron-sulfur subunit B family protein [Proteobacteria bacterium]|nr:CoB--CoM heterodisulfide reductase iron-sulfur subunit B family protein [Pseudomonadota bacterium]
MIEREYAYYSGCSLEGTASEYDASMRAVLKELDVNFREPDDWSCCGSTPAHTVNHVFAAALAARNLALVEKIGLNTIITPCPSCMMAFKKAQHGMTKSESFKNEVNELLDEPYECGVESKSALQVMYEDIGLDAVSQRVTHALPGLKVAPYYGCILNRPPEVAKFDDPENPISMDKILLSAGVEVSDFAFKLECCGAAFGVVKREMVNQLTYKVLSMALDSGANCIAVACPLCQQNLDLRQGQVNSTTGSSFNIPILYFTQIIGLTYGLSPKALGMDKLIVSAEQIIRSRVTVEEMKKRTESEAQVKAKKPEKKTVIEEAKPEENE